MVIAVVASAQHPGMGGWASHTMGGANGICGDMGRMGMVCITYC